MQGRGSVTIKANELNTDRLNITGNSSFTVARGGKVTSGSTIINSGTLTNEGEFVSNGAFEKEEDGRFINKGTISGTGSLPDGAKQTPDPITDYTAKISEIIKKICRSMFQALRVFINRLTPETCNMNLLNIQEVIREKERLTRKQVS